MSTAITWSTQSPDASATEAFGEQLGQRLRGGEVIELVSDLGGGKTTLTRGIARGVGSHDVVGSPTFTLSKVYKAPKFDLHHFDFYRLKEAGLMEYELGDIIGDPGVVLIIEWGSVVEQVLPDQRLTITINQTPEAGRTLVCHYPKELAYLITP